MCKDFRDKDEIETRRVRQEAKTAEMRQPEKGSVEAERQKAYDNYKRAMGVI